MFDTQERELTVSDLNEKNQPLLQALNLTGTISKNISAINPRNKSVAIWAGVDIHIPLLSCDDMSIECLAHNYFELTNQELRSIYWLPVVKIDNGDSHYYKTARNKDLSVNKTEGFIFVNNYEIQEIFENLGDVAFEKFGDEAPAILDDDIECAVESIIDNELAEYSVWANSGFLDITISGLGDRYSQEGDPATDVDTAFEALIASMQVCVDRQRSVISMVLQINNSPSDNSEILSKLTAVLQSNFGVRFIYGSYEYNIDRKEFSVNLLGDKIPALQDIVKEHGVKIIEGIEKHSKALVDKGIFKSLDTWNVAKLLTTDVPFNDLPELISHALIYSFVETVVGMDIIQLSHKNKY